MYLLSQANVATVTGSLNDKLHSFSYATSEEILTEALKEIKETVTQI
jgi:aspartate aminotransferase